MFSISDMTGICFDKSVLGFLYKVSGTVLFSLQEFRGNEYKQIKYIFKKIKFHLLASNIDTL